MRSFQDLRDEIYNPPNNMCMKHCQAKMLTLALVPRDYSEYSLGRREWLLSIWFNSISSPSSWKSGRFYVALITWLVFMERPVPSVGHFFRINYYLESEECNMSHLVSTSYQKCLRGPPRVKKTFHSLRIFHGFGSYHPGARIKPTPFWVKLILHHTSV